MVVGIVGTGGMGGVHASKYRQMPGVEIVAYDRDPSRLNAFSERFSAPAASSLDELLGQCGAVDVCLPTALHRAVAVAALEAGKPTLIEKPLAGTRVDAEAIAEASARTGAPAMPAHVVRFFPEFARARALVADGKIGKPAAARTRRGGRFPTGSDGWFRDLAQSGGVLMDVAVHDFDWLGWTIGPVKRVTARSVAMRWQAGDPPGDYGLATLEFENGAVGHVEATWMDPVGFRVAFEVCGSEGMIEYDSREAATVRTHVSETPVLEAPLAPTDDPYFRQLRAFLDAVEGGGPMPVPIEDGVRAVAVAEAALESARTGRTISVA